MRIQWRPEDKELAEFIDRFLDTFCTWDVLVYLANNMDEAVSAKRLRGLVGRPLDDVAACLDRLAELGLLVAEAAPVGAEAGGYPTPPKDMAAAAGPIYRIADDETRRAALKRFASGQQDRYVRMEALHKVMSRAQAKPAKPFT